MTRPMTETEGQLLPSRFAQSQRSRNLLKPRKPPKPLKGDSTACSRSLSLSRSRSRSLGPQIRGNGSSMGSVRQSSRKNCRSHPRPTRRCRRRRLAPSTHRRRKTSALRQQVLAAAAAAAAKLAAYPTSFRSRENASRRRYCRSNRSSHFRRAVGESRTRSMVLGSRLGRN